MAEREKVYEHLEPEKVYITQIGLDRLRSTLVAREEVLRTKKEDAAVETDDEWVHHNEAARDAKLAFFRAEDDVANLRRVLSSPLVIIEPNQNADVVDIGNNVTVEFTDDEIDNFIIVGKHDIGANDSFISFESPMARALLGREKGERVTFEVSGERQIQVRIKNITPGEF